MERNPCNRFIVFLKLFEGGLGGVFFKKFVFSALFFLLFNAFLLTSASAYVGKIRWYGQGCFLVTSKKGLKVLIDPFHDIGYPEPQVSPDVILISHEHYDSNNAKVANNTARIIHGLREHGRRFNPVDINVDGVRIRNLLSYHDKSRGSLRGLNSIFIIEDSGFTYVHLGNLGHILSKKQVKAIGKHDVLMVPVGGFYVLDGHDATKVVRSLSPRITIPMYYGTSVNTRMNLGMLDNFLAGKSKVERAQRGTLMFDYSNLPAFGSILVMEWKPPHLRLF